MPGVRPLEEVPADMLAFGNVSGDTMRSICQASIPGWASVPSENIRIDQLCEGLSNQNFKVHLKSVTARMVPCVLFRVYGKDAHTLYDGELELKIVQMLSEYQVAPTIYANGEGWRIEEWHFSVPLPNRSMRNPAIFTQVAAHMGRLHKLSSRSDFPIEIRSCPVLSTSRLGTWATAFQSAAAALRCEEGRRQALDVDEVFSERDWLTEFVTAEDPKIKGSGLDVVFSHWDSQENNILQTQYGLRFIDFEYSGMEHQAFDIATYFVECTLDYLWDKPPFYKVSLADFPSEREQRLFCSIYLSEYLETTIRPSDLSVSVLFERVQRFVLVVHHVWAMWSVIRAPQAPTVNEFDYLEYAQTRWFMYKWAKRAVLAGRSLAEGDV
jgi:choline kinase